jgi:hypothetical protein
MARFYFCMQKGDRLIPDEEGMELAGPDVAHAEATMAAREVLSECIRRGKDLEVEALIVTDGDGRPIFGVRFEGLLPPRLKRS